jgi:hypothetical protein
MELVRRLNTAMWVPPLCCQATAGLFDFCEQPNCTVLHPGDVLRRLRCLHSFHLVSSLTPRCFHLFSSTVGSNARARTAQQVLDAALLQECIDRWLLSSTDYSRPAACPICNQPLAIGGATA